MNAQIPFSMEEEVADRNTPEGWNDVELPRNIPAITAANTFYITNYGASTSSADNTSAIQAALNAAQSAGGGMVVVPAGEWMLGRIQIGSKTILHLCEGAMLKVLAYSDQVHTSKVPYITNKSGASDIVIEGESKETSIIEGQGGPWWDAVEQKESGLQRGALIRFENGKGSRFLFRNFRMQNAPGTNLTLGNSGRGTHNTVHDVSIYAPASHDVADPSHNTDGIPIWAAYANIYDCDIDTGDDNVVTDSNAQFIHVWNCHFKAGHGASLGSYTTNMHDIIYENLTFVGTDCGFRLKSNRDRSGDVYNIVFRNCNMYNVASPISITSWYDTLPDSPASAAASPDPLIETTPRFHDILLQNVYVSGHTSYKSSDKNYYGLFIYGRPESLVKDVTFDNVHITHSKGIKMDFCEGIKFLCNCSFEVKNSNKTEKNAVATTSLENVMEEKYDGSYSWREEGVILSKDTYKSYSTSGETKTYKFSNGWSIANSASKIWSPGNYSTGKYSKDVEYIINIPDGLAVSSISFMGYSNSDAGDCWLANLNGTEYGEEDYRFVSRKDNVCSIYTVTFDNPVSGTLTFIPGGNQACWGIYIIAGEAPYLRGDANGDGEIGMPDVMYIVNYILGTPAEDFNAQAADANLDGEIGMPDVMYIVQYILNGKFPDE